MRRCDCQPRSQSLLTFPSLQFVAEQAVEKNTSLKQEYDKVFKAVQQQRQKESADEEARQLAINPHDLVDSIPEHVEIYKAKLREKEREVKELSERMKRLLASEHKHVVHVKVASQERVRYESEVATLKMQV